MRLGIPGVLMAHRPAMKTLDGHDLWKGRRFGSCGRLHHQRTCVLNVGSCHRKEDLVGASSSTYDCSKSMCVSGLLPQISVLHQRAMVTGLEMLIKPSTERFQASKALLIVSPSRPYLGRATLINPGTWTPLILESMFRRSPVFLSLI